jgi:hypothetical protein
MVSYGHFFTTLGIVHERKSVGICSENEKTTSDCKPGSVFNPCGLEAIIRLDVRLLGAFISNPNPKVKRAKRLSLPIRSCSRQGFPCPEPHGPGGELLPRLFTLTASLAGGSGIFSVALSVKRTLYPPPRPLAGAAPCGARTFLPLAFANQRLPV